MFRIVRSGQSIVKNRNFSSFIDADKGKLGTKVYHAVGILLTGFPLVLLFQQPFLTFPMDLAFGALIPIHSHIGWNYIISDYVPKQFRTIARYSTAGVTLVMFLGILKLNLAGPGLSKTLKSLWSSPENSEKSH